MCEKIFAEIKNLEKSLLLPKNRKSKTILENILREDFVEFGSSGKIYTKKDTIEALSYENNQTLEAKNFQFKLLSPTICLVMYTTIRENRETLRSSIWVYNNHWQMTFHQGTKA